VLIGIAISVSPLCAAQSGAVLETGVLENNITAEVEGTVIHYHQQSSWNESEFSAILENKEEFKTALIHDFTEKISRYGERGEYAVAADVEFEETKKATVLTVEVERIIIHYQKQSFWNESEFFGILENREEFKTALIQDFTEKISRYGERGEYAVDADVEFDEPKKATVLKCDVHDAITETDDSYRATFIWLLSPLGLDFIDDKFEESKEGLSWDGEVDGISTSITIKLPLQESVYEAWQQPVGHCHGHV
jgi:hypothetical protein